MNTIGQKIRALRKEKKMTLDALAGDQLSKGMLSLIENGKAQPSMESLRYIAGRLGVDASTLVEEERIENIADLLQQAEEMLLQYSAKLYDSTVRAQFEAFFAPIEPKLQRKTYEEIRLVDISYRFQMTQNPQFEDHIFLQLAEQYEGIYAYDRMISAYNMVAWKYFYHKDYEETKRYFELAERMVEKHHWHINYLTRLDVYYNMMVIASALFDEELTEDYYQKAMKLALSKRVFYKIDDTYRLKFAMHLANETFDEAAIFLKKIEAVVSLSEDDTIKGLYKLCQVHYMNMALADYEQTLAFITQLRQTVSNEIESSNAFMYTNEEIYALYMLGRYDEALTLAKENVIPFYMNHPIDLMIYYLNSAVRAHCYAIKGHFEEARRDILYALECIKSYKPSLYTKKIQHIYAEIQQLMPM